MRGQIPSFVEITQPDQDATILLLLLIIFCGNGRIILGTYRVWTLNSARASSPSRCEKSNSMGGKEKDEDGRGR